MAKRKAPTQTSREVETAAMVRKAADELELYQELFQIVYLVGQAWYGLHRLAKLKANVEAFESEAANVDRHKRTTSYYTIQGLLQDSDLMEILNNSQPDPAFLEKLNYLATKYSNKQ